MGISESTLTPQGTYDPPLTFELPETFAEAAMRLVHASGNVVMSQTQYKELMEILDEYMKENERLEGIVDEYRKSLENLELPEDTKIIVPGYNGPRPEHVHLSRDSMQDILRESQKWKKRKAEHIKKVKNWRKV